MGSQIAIAQSQRDERDLIAFLERRQRFLALPRFLSSPEARAVELGRCEARKQLFFPAEDATAMLAQIREIKGRPGEYALDRVRMRGLFIEWNRTLWDREDEAQAGRLYYQRPSSAPSPSGRTMDRTMSALRRWIRKSYPMRSAERYAIYVGPHLWELVCEAGARVVYPNGSPVSLVENS